jgi:hypothetical protein
MKVEQKPRQEEAPQEPAPIILENWGWYMENAHLHGNAYGHPNFPDGSPVITSKVVFMDSALGIAKTRNTVYILRNKA